MNPSRTRVATGASHVNDIAVYSVPDLDPVMVGYQAHSYWIFDIIWLDDDHVVSGAGDNKLALWSIGEDQPIDTHSESPSLPADQCNKLYISIKLLSPNFLLILYYKVLLSINNSFCAILYQLHIFFIF